MRRLATLLLLNLAACGGPAPAPAQPTFTLRVEPPVLELRVTQTATLKVMVSRSGGFVAPVMLSLGGENTGLESAPVTVLGGEGSLSIKVTDAAKTGTSFPAVVGTAGALTKSETLTLRVAKAVAAVSSVTVNEGGGSAQVRQGFGSVTLQVQGSNLERVTAFRVGDLETALLPGRTPTGLELQVRVPHGATLGAKRLVLTTEGGDADLLALTVTPITSGPGGSDASGAGTPERPYRSLKRALSQSSTGDTVRLLNGTYSAANGETWASDDGTTVIPNVPAGVTVEGESRAGVILSGPNTLATSVALAFSGGGGARALTARGFTAGFRAGGSVSLENVAVQAVLGGGGVKADGGSLRVAGSEFSGGAVGLLLFGTVDAELVGGSAHDNGTGVSLSGAAKLRVTGGFAAYANGAGMQVSGQAEAALEGSQFHSNRATGVLANGDSVLRVSGCEFYANATSGLEFGGRSLTLRGSTLRDNRGAGLTVSRSPTKVDLGTFTDPGNNDLRGNSAALGQISDIRLYVSGLGQVVFTLSATRLNGVTPRPDIYTGQYSNLPYFSIAVPNVTVQIF